MEGHQTFLISTDILKKNPWKDVDNLKFIDYANRFDEGEVISEAKNLKFPT
jgi:hypothetical protein